MQVGQKGIWMTGAGELRSQVELSYLMTVDPEVHAVTGAAEVSPLDMILLTETLDDI